MGLSMSMIQKAGNPTQILTDQLFASMEENIKNFEQFHIAFLEVLNKINAAMPGVHYDAPTRAEVETYYHMWRKDPKNKEVLTTLLEKSKIRKTDKTLLFTGVAAPPVAMIGKRAAGNIPTLNFVKIVPDVLFVPSVTLLAVVGMKVVRMNKKIPEATAKTKGPAGTQPEATDKTKGPAGTQPEATDKTKVPEATDKAKGPEATDKAKGPEATDKAKEPEATDKAKRPEATQPSADTGAPEKM
ncbi:hypothetical protein AAC387_Pa08g1967 [Persea americana]